MSTKGKIRQYFARMHTEMEPTAPGGGRMRYRVSVEEPDEGFTVAMIGIDEESVIMQEGSHPERVYEADRMLLDIEAATFVRDSLTEAIEVAKRFQADAEARAFTEDVEAAIEGDIADMEYTK